MNTREKWKLDIAGPWPLFSRADEKSVSHEVGPDCDWTWSVRDGVPFAFPSVCQHRGMPLANCRVKDGHAICSYHGQKIAPLQNASMFRFNGFDWIGQRNRAIEFLSSQSENQPWLKEVCRLQGCSSAPLILCLENFLDATHTAHVHPKLVREAGCEKWIKARGVAWDWGFEIEYTETDVQSGWLARMGEPPRLTSFGRYLHPCAAQVDYVGLNGRSYFQATAFMRPGQDGTEVLVVVKSSLRRMGLGRLNPIRFVTKALFAKVLRQDIDALDRAWSGIVKMGWAPDDLRVSSQDLAWPWMRRWMNQCPPEPGENFDGSVLA